MTYSLQDGTDLIHFARNNIKNYLSTGSRVSVPDDLKKRFSEKQGAFCTLNVGKKIRENPLRGCIGVILPHYPLIEAIREMSVAAAVEDPRFPNVKNEEMEHIVIEISILTVPERIIVTQPEDYAKEIVVGRDGLIVSHGARRGLLLPQVPVEHERNWDSMTFLEHTCQKAWLPQDAWKNLKKTQVERFTAQIFEETVPNGPVREKAIGE
ncbi:MAG: TIGR00296 family protein [Promethearchaeota archaeon]